MPPWRDIFRSEPIVITAPAFEPLSRAEAKLHCKIDSDVTEDDPWIDRNIPAARRQVEHDLNYTLVRTTYDLLFDRYPSERWMPMPLPPLVSIDGVFSTDEDGVETAMTSTDYYADTAAKPGRLILKPNKSWPSDLRDFQAGRVRYTAGYSAAPKSVSTLTQTSGTATATCAAHGFSTGQRITLAGANQDAYNGTFRVTVPDANSFTFPVVGSPTTPATGTIQAVNLGVSERHVAAIALLLAHWYENREAINVGNIVNEYQFGYDALISDRLRSLG